jgi:hypothetical protein
MFNWRMKSTRMLRRVALVRTDISEECNSTTIRVTRIGEIYYAYYVQYSFAACVGC